MRGSNRLLVFGGAGFIGSNFIRYIFKKHPSIKVLNYDALTYSGNLQNLNEVSKNKNYQFIKGNIADKKQLSRVFKKFNPDYVINLAAESITENTYIPIHTIKGTAALTFKELWDNQAKSHKITKTKNGEAIFLNHNNVKALSFLNGGQWMPIRAITRHWYKGKIIKLNQKFGIIEATPNHSIYSANLELKNPRDNPELLVVRSINDNHKKYFKKNKQLLEFLAAYITEGNATKNKANGGYIIEIGQNDKDWLKRIGAIGKKLFKVNFNIVKGNGAYHLQFTNKALFHELISKCGKYAYGKYFPNWIFDLNPELRHFFWHKLLEGDGTKDGRYTTTSFKLANQISLLLALQGERFTVSERITNNIKWRTSYNFRTGLPMHYGLQKKTLTEFSYEGWVYDLEIEKTHNFICGIGNIVCHNTHVDRSIHVGAKEFIDTNITGVFNLLELVKANGGIKNFLQVSTDETFGSLALNSRRKFTEEMPFAPNAPYAATKAGGDLMCRSYFQTFKLPVVVTHCSNNYGPNQYPEKLIPFFILRMLENKKLPLYGDGKNVRDWIYVLDHCSALEACLFKGRPGEVYNIGADNEMNNLEIASLILKIFNRDKSWIEFVTDRPGHDRRYAIDSSKIKRELGWEPKYDFRHAFKKTVDWYLNNKEWVNNVRKKTGVFNPHIDLWRAHKNIKTIRY